MSRTSRKFIAVLMLLLLPLSTGSALAASVAMQMQQGECHEALATMPMSHAGMDEHQMHHDAASPAADDNTASCSACGICHLACTGYLAVPGSAISGSATTARDDTPYLLVFNSVTTTPLLPPPLARA
jgi:hypothetical protein